tara:strand:+ start:32 stop:409 length:378 start_codon:yes stop_codon:yes gene_type:complete
MHINKRILKNINEIGLKSQKVELNSVKKINDFRQELDSIAQEMEREMQSALSQLDQTTRKGQTAMDKITDIKNDIDEFVNKVDDLGVDLPGEVKADINQIEALESIIGNAIYELEEAQASIMNSI